MPKWKLKSVVLTVPQRLALQDYTPTLVGAGGLRPLKPTRSHPWSVIPTRPVRLRSASGDVEASYRADVLKRLDGPEPMALELRGRHGNVPAVAVPALADRKARTVVRTADVDAVWQVRDDTAVLMADGNLPAEDGGPSRCTLVEFLSDRPPSWLEPVAAWTTSRRPGWVQGGLLGAACENCQTDLIWFDWRIAGADQKRSSWLVGCPEHGPVPWPRTTVHPLVQTRRQLDGALWVTPVAASDHHCYAFDLVGLQPGAVYVGETAHTLEHRLNQHRTGHNAAKELSKQGVTMGALREALLPDLPPLLTRSASRAAEQWVAAALSHRGLVVYGGH